ncbi:hypothetical protein RN001_012788 [Aquatica leii]|uniref:Transmembrane protein 17 n=1 Tax=Aquatica leii TaxID=1421715 RepID=A0AAN7P7X8_9COLE|nr:hypothetical protein RN001_012788 [Aquatica leii]
MDWKETVTQVSERVFPGISQKLNDNDNIENEVTSNLPLQMALYFNVVFAPIWILILLLFLKDNFYCYTELYKFLTLTVIIAMILIELVRLYLGYEGNLRDKIPELAGFWMLSVLLQLPLQAILLCNPYFNLHVIEVIAQSVMFILLVFELIFGYQALKFTSSNQALYYKLMKLRSDVSENDIENKYKLS